MSGKKKKNKSPRVPQPLVRLSQCMIVKNEEKNIEKALGWAKGIAFEQIVVDTGSTDRTVEIAEKLGAKIYHFEWIDDFAAAKNYAIEQASGNWIAFLDADEFFTDEDAKKLMVILKQIQADPEFRRDYHVLLCPWVQLNDNGKPFAIHEQNRIFQNRPDVRYIGRIHESLTNKGKVPYVPEISIMHTGYTKTAFKDTQKAERNIKLIREEMEKRPDDPGLMVYLSDALCIEPSTPEKREEAVQLCIKALEKRHYMHRQFTKNAYLNIIPKFIRDPDSLELAYKYAKQAYGDFPGEVDYSFFYGAVLNRKGECKEAFHVLKECERQLANSDSLSVSFIVLPNPDMLFYELAYAAQVLGDIENTIKYVTLTLKEDKYRASVLPKYLNILRENSVDDNSVFELLGKIYDFNSVKDKLFVAKCVKRVGNNALLEKIYQLLSDEDRKWVEGEKEMPSNSIIEQTAL